MKTNSQLGAGVAQIKKLPAFIQPFVMTKLFGSKIKFAGHSGVKFEKLTHNECVVSLKNKKKVQNHIGGIHAAAMALLTETATGFVFGMNVPKDKLPLIKKMDIDYVRRSAGDMKAVACLSDQQIEFIQSSEKGEIVVPVTITDEDNAEPIKASMTWAWTAKR